MEHFPGLAPFDTLHTYAASGGHITTTWFATGAPFSEVSAWYEQRLSVEADAEARKIIEDARHEEYKYFAMDFEFLLRRRPEWRAIVPTLLEHWRTAP